MLVNLSEQHKSHYERKRERERKIAAMRSVISTWTKEEMKVYIYNHNKEFPCTDAGMAAILERFIHSNEFRIETMSEELKLGFDLVLAIARNNRISLETAELINEFIKTYKEVIQSYDRQVSQTYKYKLKKAYEQSLEIVEAKMAIEQEMRVKY